MNSSHGSDGSFPREGAWFGKAGLAAAGLMIGVALGMSISPWAVSPPQETAIQLAPQGVAPAAPLAAVDGPTAATLLFAPSSASPAEVQGMEVCWGGIEQVRC